MLDKDANGNVVVGKGVRIIDSSNCIVHTPEEKKVIVQGLEDCIVAEYNNTLLICKKEDEQKIKEWGK